MVNLWLWSSIFLQWWCVLTTDGVAGRSSRSPPDLLASSIACAKPIRSSCTRSVSRKQADGLIFIGLSLSVSRQTQFDFNLLQDRDYRYVCDVSDDGWLVGGGEGGGDASLSNAWKLASLDSAHIEIVRIGNGDLLHGGMKEEMIFDAMKHIDIPQIRVMPSYVTLNDDYPPDLELHFAASENLELVALRDTFRTVFTNPSVTFPRHFSMRIARGLNFYSTASRDEFLSQASAVVEQWRKQRQNGVLLRPDRGEVEKGVVTQEEVDKPGGVYLFWGRNEVRKYFPSSVPLPSFRVPPFQFSPVLNASQHDLCLSTKYIANHKCVRSSSHKHAHGLIFIGLSLSRSSSNGNNASVSRQTQFDFNLLQDRDYLHVCRHNEDGWLVGGGEGGGESQSLSNTWKLANPDSAHIEIAHISNGDSAHGGLTQEQIIQKMERVTFPPIRLRPSYVALDDRDPPEVEIRFNADENAELAKLQKDLRKVFENPSIEFPPYFHMTISRKMRFYSSKDRDHFLSKANSAVDAWQMEYPNGALLQPDQEEVGKGVTQLEVDKPGGVYLFWGRNKPFHYFPPVAEGRPSSSVSDAPLSGEPDAGIRHASSNASDSSPSSNASTAPPSGEPDIGTDFDYHKSPFPLDWKHDGLTMTIAFFSLLIAAGGGIGGGGILVPVYMLVLGFRPKHAVALSNITILGGSIANTLLNSRRRHPSLKDTPLIDWDLIIIMEPTTIFGAVFGSLVSKVLPNIILQVLLSLVLAYMARHTLAKGIKGWKKESLQHMEARANGDVAAAFEMQSVTSHEASAEPIELVPQGIEAVDTTSYLELDSDNEGGNTLVSSQKQRQDRQKKIMLLTLCFAGTCLLTVLKGGGHFDSPLGFECGSRGFWWLYFASVPWVLAFAVYFRWILVREFKRKVLSGHIFVKGEIQWNDKNTIRYPAICTLSGIFAGLFGVGGGIVKGPLMLEMGVLPAVSSATAAAMILYTSSAASASFAVFGLLHYTYGAIFFVLGFFSTIIGQQSLTTLVKKYNRESPIVLSIGFVIGLSSILVAINTVARSYGRPFSDLMRPHGICNTEA